MEHLKEVNNRADAPPLRVRTRDRGYCFRVSTILFRCGIVAAMYQPFGYSLELGAPVARLGALVTELPD